jgi:hypothetical protein
MSTRHKVRLRMLHEPAFCSSSPTSVKRFSSCISTSSMFHYNILTNTKVPNWSPTSTSRHLTRTLLPAKPATRRNLYNRSNRSLIAWPFYIVHITVVLRHLPCEWRTNKAVNKVLCFRQREKEWERECVCLRVCQCVFESVPTLQTIKKWTYLPSGMNIWNKYWVRLAANRVQEQWEYCTNSNYSMTP